MNDAIRKLLFDVLMACEQIELLNANKTLLEYEQNAMQRAATERMFEIIGEALARLTKIAPEIADQITDRVSIVAFRNRIIHSYDTVDNRTVWGVYEGHLPVLKQQVQWLLKD